MHPNENRPMTLRMPRVTLTGIIAILVGTVTLIGAGAGFVVYIAPLKTLPTEVNSMSSDINNIGRVQAVQTEALKVLAEVASDTKTMRRDVDRHSMDIEVVKERLNHIEKRP